MHPISRDLCALPYKWHALGADPTRARPAQASGRGAATTEGLARNSLPTLYLGAVVGEVRACTYGWTMCRGEERMLTRAPDVVLGTLLREGLLNNKTSANGNCCRCRRPVGLRPAPNSAARCTSN